MYTKRAYLGHSKSVLNTEVSLFQGCPLRGVPPYSSSKWNHLRTERRTEARLHGSESLHELILFMWPVL